MSAWDVVEQREGFIAWGHMSEHVRYSIETDTCPGVYWQRWVLAITPRATERCGGRFYDGAEDHPEGGIEWARASSERDAIKMTELLTRFDAGELRDRARGDS